MGLNWFQKRVEVREGSILFYVAKTLGIEEKTKKKVLVYIQHRCAILKAKTTIYAQHVLLFVLREFYKVCIQELPIVSHLLLPVFSDSYCCQ